MSIKILPIFNYPFSNTQSQILDNIGMFEQGKASELSQTKSIGYNFNMRLSTFNYSNYNPFEDDDRTLLNTTPDIKAHTPLGQDTFTLKLSQSSFSQDLQQTFNIGELKMFDIKMLVFFKDYDIDVNGINKYFYYVSNIRKINATVYEFDLEIDAFKTYYKEVLELDGGIPERYFIASHELISDETEMFDRHVLNYQDPLQSIPQNIGERTVLATPSSFKNNINIYSGLWKYYYMRYTGDENLITRDTQFLNDGYFLIVLPAEQEKLSVLDAKLSSVLINSPQLIKAVISIIPPVIDAMNWRTEITRFDYEDGFFTVDSNNNDVNTTLYTRQTYLRVVSSNKIGSYNNILKGEIYDAFNWSDASPYVSKMLVMIDNKPEHDRLMMYNPETKKIPIKEPFIYDTVSFGIGDASYQNGDFHEIEGFNNFSQIGFIGETKMSIPSFSQSRFKMELVHSLLSSRERIYIYEGDYSQRNRERYIERVEELNSGFVKDGYEQYLLQNKNAITQKEKQLYKYADRDTIVRGIATVGVGALAVAGTIATGGTGLIVAGGLVSGGMGVYNTVSNLTKNAQNRLMFEAEMQDRKRQPVQFTSSNFISGLDETYYMPIFETYLFDRKPNFTVKPYYYGENMSFDKEILSKYGLYYPFNDTKKISDLLTRKHYNYIQLKTSEFMHQTGEIPSKLFMHIKEVLENGLTYTSIDYLKNKSLRNEEV